jgi:periplasmic protein TonB
MAYADQQMSGNKVIAIIIVAIIHIALGYALITGLAYDVVKEAVERVTTVDVSEPPPPPEDEPPPPPPDDAAPPPPVAPPPPISIAVAPPPIQTQQTIPPPRPPAVIVPPPAPVAAPAPPPAPPPPQRANPVPRGNPGRWVSNDDYPSRAIREEAQGTVRFTLTVGPDGRASDCQVTGSSGNSSLDETACRLLRQRARFDPKLDSAGNPTTGTWSSSFRWVLQN